MIEYIFLSSLGILWLFCLGLWAVQFAELINWMRRNKEK